MQIFLGFSATGKKMLKYVSSLISACLYRLSIRILVFLLFINLICRLITTTSRYVTEVEENLGWTVCNYDSYAEHHLTKRFHNTELLPSSLRTFREHLLIKPFFVDVLRILLVFEHLHVCWYSIQKPFNLNKFTYVVRILFM